MGTRSTAGAGRARFKPIVLELLLFSFSAVAFQATRLGVSLLAAAVLAPVEYGHWGLALAVLSYGIHANVGVVSGLNRELPTELGAGHADIAARYERAALGVVIAVGAAAAVVGSLIGLAGGGLFVMLLGLAVGIQQLYVFLQASLRSHLEFNRASVQQLLMAVALPLAAVPLLSTLASGALVFGQVVAYSAAVALVLLKWRPALRPTMDASAAGVLARTGLPIAAAGVAFALLTSADRWIALVTLGEEALGAYSLASIVSSGVLLLAMVVAQHFYPRMAQLYGESRDPALIWRAAIRQSAVVISLLVPVVAVLLAVAWLAVPTVLPQYAAALAPVTILAPALVLLTAAGGFANLLVVLGQAPVYLGSLVLACAVEAGIGAVLAANGLRLEGIAMGATAGYGVLLVLMIAFASRARRLRRPGG